MKIIQNHGYQRIFCWSHFHQHFACSFFVQKFCTFCTYILGLYFFGGKNIDPKDAFKMLVKLISKSVLQKCFFPDGQYRWANEPRLDLVLPAKKRSLRTFQKARVNFTNILRAAFLVNSLRQTKHLNLSW